MRLKAGRGRELFGGKASSAGWGVRRGNVGRWFTPTQVYNFYQQLEAGCHQRLQPLQILRRRFHQGSRASFPLPVGWHEAGLYRTAPDIRWTHT